MTKLIYTASIALVLYHGIAHYKDIKQLVLCCSVEVQP